MITARLRRACAAAGPRRALRIPPPAALPLLIAGGVSRPRTRRRHGARHGIASALAPVLAAAAPPASSAARGGRPVGALPSLPRAASVRGPTGGRLGPRTRRIHGALYGVVHAPAPVLAIAAASGAVPLKAAPAHPACDPPGHRTAHQTCWYETGGRRSGCAVLGDDQAARPASPGLSPLRAALRARAYAAAVARFSGSAMRLRRHSRRLRRVPSARHSSEQ